MRSLFCASVRHPAPHAGPGLRRGSLRAILAGRVDHVRDELRTLVDEEAAPTQQVACRAFAARIDVGHREHAAAQQTGDLGGVDAIVLDLPPWIAFMYSAWPSVKGIA